MFRPFIETPLDKVRVVFVFPEPYYSKGLANGLALGYNGDKSPYMFDAFLDELKADYNVRLKRTDLSQWARRGILLWNARPTTLIGHSRGHTGLQWEELTREVIETTYLVNPDTVYVLVGQEVQKTYGEILPRDANVLLLGIPIPPVFEGTDDFRGSGVFRKVNELIKGGWKNKILWDT